MLSIDNFYEEGSYTVFVGENNGFNSYTDFGSGDIPVSKANYDALTAADRPYKKAVSVDRALYILDLETKDNHIDPELVRLFQETEVYKALEND